MKENLLEMKRENPNSIINRTTRQRGKSQHSREVGGPKIPLSLKYKSIEVKRLGIPGIWAIGERNISRGPHGQLGRS